MGMSDGMDGTAAVTPINRAKADRQWQALMDEHGYGKKGSDDPYEVVSSHGRDSFYLMSADKRGFSTSVRVRLSPQTLSEISALIQSGKWPWRTMSQFVGDAVWHRLHDVSDWTKEGRVIRMLAAEMMQSQMEVYQREMESLSKTVDQFEKAAELAVKSRDWPMLTAMLINTNESVEDIREPYRGQLQGLIAKYRPQMPEEYRPDLG